MRNLRMWHGLIIIWTVRYVKIVVRRIAEQMKVWARLLIAWSDEVTPRWSRELFNKCYLADVEVHLEGEVFVGKIEAIYQEYSGKNSELVVSLRSAIRKKSFPLNDTPSVNQEFRLAEYGPPVVIKDDGYDCVWTSFKNGYLAIFFH